MASYFDRLEARRVRRHAALPPPRVPVLDSRLARPGDTQVFIALRGPRFDGHDFLAEAHARGIRQFVLSGPVPAALTDSTVWQVKDPLRTLQDWAAWHRARFAIPVVAVTGSNGKTIVKEWAAQLIGGDVRLHRSPKSYNSQVGVALSLLGLDDTHEAAIIEAGISRRGEAARLNQLIRPTLGVLTSLGAAHDEGFADRREKLTEKLRILRGADTLLLRTANGEDQAATEVLLHSHQLHHLHIDPTGPPGAVHGELRTPRGSVPFAFPLPHPDAASRSNAALAYHIARHLGIAAPTLRQRTARLRPVAMRLEVRRARHRSWLLDDSYSADLDSLRIALAFFRRQNTAPTTTLILSDFLESGRSAESLYATLAGLLGPPYPARLIGIGSAIVRLREQLPAAVVQHYFPDTDTALADFDWDELVNTGILLKGARAFRFERIAARLRARQHRTELRIDLDALRNNLHRFRQRLAPATRTLVMVKAAAYGGGGLEVARLLAAERVDYLGVAYTDEGVALRRGGIELPMLVLNPAPESYADLLTYRLEPELYQLSALHELGAFVRARGARCSVHLKIDTGMRRLGFAPAELPGVAAALAVYPELRVATVFTHLAGSEAPKHAAFTRQQLAAFDTAYADLCATLGYRPARHALNTAGILRFPAHRYEMVRLGVGLYGIDPTGGDIELTPVFELRATVSQVRTVAAGESVGYDRRGAADRARRIATVSVGYADGLPRRAGNGAYALRVRGLPAPLVGNVCMDMCMIDVTDVPSVRAGDPVTVFGPTAPVEALAQATGTIAYEILTGIGPRVPRVYTTES